MINFCDVSVHFNQEGKSSEVKHSIHAKKLGRSPGNFPGSPGLRTAPANNLEYIQITGQCWITMAELEYYILIKQISSIHGN